MGVTEPGRLGSEEWVLGVPNYGRDCSSSEGHCGGIRDGRAQCWASSV